MIDIMRRMEKNNRKQASVSLFFLICQKDMSKSEQKDAKKSGKRQKYTFAFLRKTMFEK